MPVVAIPGTRACSHAPRPHPPPATHRRPPAPAPSGQTIPAAVAAIIINNKSVEPANDGLFPDLLAQTWRVK